MSNKSWKAKRAAKQAPPVPKSVPTIREMHREIARLERIAELCLGDVWEQRELRIRGVA